MSVTARRRLKITHVFAAVFTATMLGACASHPSAQEVEAVPGLINSGGMFLGEDAPSPAKIKAILDEAETHPLGSKENPVRADMPAGQREYLYRLRCSDGAAPTFHRVGNFGPGIYGSIIDGYEVVCTGAEPAKSLIFMDMYFPGFIETRPVPGFTIVN